jgi:copper(I)-binding protein
MKKLHPIRPLLSSALLGLICLSATAADRPASPVIENAWIRALPGDLPAAAYFRMRNSSDGARRLVGAESSAFAMAMLHQSSDQGGQSQMKRVDGVEVPAHGSASCAPGSYHLMLMHAQQPLTVGATVPITLHFDDGSAVAVPFMVKGAAASGR